MDSLFRENPYMAIAKTISRNLTAWMDATPALDTLQKLEAKSGVGFGTIRRAKNGEGNITVEKLEAIAAAFGQPAAALLAEARAPEPLYLNEPRASYSSDPLAERYEAASPAARAVVDMILMPSPKSIDDAPSEMLSSAVKMALLAAEDSIKHGIAIKSGKASAA